MQASRETILSLIQETQALLIEDNVVPHDYHTLKSAIIKYELDEEIRALVTLITQNNWIDLFKARCKERGVWNMNSCLSFSALPQGSCNVLYSKIAFLLFEPKTLGDLLLVLLPNDATCLTMELFLEAPKAKRPSLKLTPQSLNSLTGQPQLDDLENFVFVDNVLFDARSFANFDFKLHKIAYELLTKTYPALATVLYEHNLSFRNLHSELLMVSGAGQTPLQVIQSLIKELTIGKSKMTGDVYATLSAQVAYTEFKSYLQSLPQPLQDAVRKIVSSVIRNLDNANCIEIGAYRLQTIINVPANQAVLNTHPTLSESELQTIKKKYAPSNPLPTGNNQAITHLPSKFLEEILARIHLRTPHDWLNVLLSFPLELYAPLIKNVRLPIPALQPFLGEIINNDTLDSKQYTAFINALNARVGPIQLTHCMVNADNVYSLNFWEKFLVALPPRDRVFVVNEVFKFNVFNFIDGGCYDTTPYAPTPELLIAIFQLLPSKDRLAAVKERVNYIKSYTYRGYPKTQCLRDILELLPSEDRLAAVKECFLDFLVQNPDFFISILALLPSKDRFFAATSIRFGICLLNFIYYSSKTLISLLEVLPLEDRLALMKNIFYFYDQDAVAQILRRDCIAILQLLIPQLLIPQETEEKSDLIKFYSTLSEWQFFMFILAKENNLTYEPKTDLFFLESKPFVTITPTHLLLDIYFQTKTDSRKDLTKVLLKRDKKQIENRLALALIAKKEGNKEEERTCIRVFIDSFKDNSLASFFQSSSKNFTREEIIPELIRRKPETAVWIEAYNTEIAQLLNLLKPVQSFGFDDHFDKHFSL